MIKEIFRKDASRKYSREYFLQFPGARHRLKNDPG